jgi:hypothetical protein
LIINLLLPGVPYRYFPELFHTDPALDSSDEEGVMHFSAESNPEPGTSKNNAFTKHQKSKLTCSFIVVA